MIDWGAIKTNLASGAIIAILGSLAGFLLGTSQSADLARKIDAATTRLDQNDKVKSGRLEFLGEAKDRLEYLCNRDKECSQRFDPMKVPE